jgi:hypothetical protein
MLTLDLRSMCRFGCAAIAELLFDAPLALAMTDHETATVARLAANA